MQTVAHWRWCMVFTTVGELHLKIGFHWKLNEFFCHSGHLLENVEVGSHLSKIFFSLSHRKSICTKNWSVTEADQGGGALRG